VPDAGRRKGPGTRQGRREATGARRKPDELPKILIVTEKLLTGYDAPILYSMYLDKPMRDHVLLQAIARVNRPYEDRDGRRKPSGFVLDFVGIFEKLEDALAFDSDEVSGVVEGIEVLQRRFEGKWASASSTGRLTFNYDLLWEPSDFRMEVIIHELLHLKVSNHGKVFRALLKAHLAEV